MQPHTHSPSPATSSPTPQTVIGLTTKAMEKLMEFQVKMPDAAGKDFRVFVEGGGCSGYQYGYTFDTVRENDEIVDLGLVRIVVDPMSLNYIRGSTVDYVETFGGGGFSVKNPNATGGCGCGTSFSV